MDNFNQELDDISLDIEWRKSELSKIEEIAYNLNEVELKIFLKSCIPLIYAHWEGFVVSSLKIVFKYLNTLRLNSEQYCDTYLTTAYEQTLKSLDESTAFEKRKKHLVTLYKDFSNTVKLNTKIDTKSNLTFKVLMDICLKTNLDIDKFKEYEDDLNELVRIRNSISHGENAYTFESFEDIEKYIELLENLMLDFQSELQDILTEKK
jgi:hypothetical protein